MNQYSNLAIISAIHITPTWTDTIIPSITINLSIESIFLSKCKVLGFLDQTVTEICKIMTSLALDPLALEVTAEQPENLTQKANLSVLQLIFAGCRSK